MPGCFSGCCGVHHVEGGFAVWGARPMATLISFAWLRRPGPSQAANLTFFKLELMNLGREAAICDGFLESPVLPKS